MRQISPLMHRIDAPCTCVRQWKDLPYADCTWETAQDIFAAGGQDCVDEFQACPANLH